MTRSVGRLNEVVHSLNPMTVGIYSLVNIHAAMNRIIAARTVDRTGLRMKTSEKCILRPYSLVPRSTELSITALAPLDRRF